ncbi:arylesterase [Pedobacter sp. UYEF25]
MKRIIFFGNSLTAGYGLTNPADEALPALIQQKINVQKLDYTVINSGISGDTSNDGLRRLDNVLKKPVDIFVLELGANDFLRGYSPHLTKINLTRIIENVRKIHPLADLLLLGMRLPAWIPGNRVSVFTDIYQQIAKEKQLELVPFLLEGVAGVSNLNMADGLHPLAAGYSIMALHIWPSLLKLIQKRNSNNG